MKFLDLFSDSKLQYGLFILIFAIMLGYFNHSINTPEYLKTIKPEDISSVRSLSQFFLVLLVMNFAAYTVLLLDRFLINGTNNEKE